MINFKIPGSKKFKRVLLIILVLVSIAVIIHEGINNRKEVIGAEIVSGK